MERHKNINFNFDESGSTTDVSTDTDKDGEEGQDDKEETDETITGNAPQAGTLYKGCYVLKTEQIGGGTKVTLMSIGSAKGLVFINNDQASIKQAIEHKIDSIAAKTDGIEGLRVPALEELKYIKDNVDAINDNLDNLGKDRFLIGSGTLYSYYF